MEADKKEPEKDIYFEATLKMNKALEKFKRQNKIRLAKSEQSAKNIILT